MVKTLDGFPGRGRGRGRATARRPHGEGAFFFVCLICFFFVFSLLCVQLGWPQGGSGWPVLASRSLSMDGQGVFSRRPDPCPDRFRPGEAWESRVPDRPGLGKSLRESILVAGERHPCPSLDGL